MKATLVRYGGAIAVWALPALAFAQQQQGGATVETIMLDVKYLLDLAVPIMITLALVYFIWGLAHFILANGDAVKMQQGRDMMIWGILALFVIVSVWGLVGIVGRTFSIDQNSRLQGNQVPLVESPFEEENFNKR